MKQEIKRTVVAEKPETHYYDMDGNTDSNYLGKTGFSFP